MKKTAKTTDSRPVAELHYSCCNGWWFKGPRGATWTSATKDWKVRAGKYRIDLSGYSVRSIPTWVAQSRDISRGSI